MGGAPDINYAPPTAQESTAEMLQAFTKYLPGFMETSNAQILPNELAQLAASRAVSPEYAALTSQIYGTTGRDLAAISDQIANESLQRQSQGALENITGPGREFVLQALETAKLADPEYFAGREAAGEALVAMLKSGLTPGESESISRGLAKESMLTGNAGAGKSPTEAVAAGLTYGSGARDRLSQALSLATGILPTFRTGVNPFEVRTPNTNTYAQGASVAQQGAGQQAAQYGNNLLNQIGSLQQANINANTSLQTAQMNNWQNPWAVGAGYAQAVGTAIGCWIAREVYGERSYKWEIFRDWMCNYAPKWLFNWYQKHGEDVSKKLKWYHKLALKPLMNLAVRYQILNYT